MLFIPLLFNLDCLQTGPSLAQGRPAEQAMGGWPRSQRRVIPGVWRPTLSTVLPLPQSAGPGCWAASLPPGSAEAATPPVSSWQPRERASNQGLTLRQMHRRLQ